VPGTSWVFDVSAHGSLSNNNSGIAKGHTLGKIVEGCDTHEQGVGSRIGGSQFADISIDGILDDFETVATLNHAGPGSASEPGIGSIPASVTLSDPTVHEQSSSNAPTAVAAKLPSTRLLPIVPR
jgi:hypothetical protein